MLGILSLLSMSISGIVKLLLLVILTSSSDGITQVKSLEFSFPKFDSESGRNLTLSAYSKIFTGTIQVTPNDLDLQNHSGRAVYNQPFKLWDRKRGMKASFNSTFVINIIPQTSPGGEGLAFILSRDSSLPDNSAGQWLGIMNYSTVGQSGNIVAIEFDTRKSYQDDLDDNHFGIDLNSIYSIKQQSLGIGPSGINLSIGINVFVNVQYNSSIGRINILMMQGKNMMKFSHDIDLSEQLPEDVFVGFSASTWANTQLNCVLSWNFTSFEVITRNNLLWLWIVIPAIGVTTLLSGISCMLYWKWKMKKEQVQRDTLIEQEIQNSSTAPQKFQLKDLKSATWNFNPIYQLGKGGFGTVYKGIICNKEVAVKRISKNSHHGKQDFIAEVTTIGNLHHKNIVKLIGWCYEKNELLLVYEFMPNGSLDKLLFCREGMEDSILSWKRRNGIICGVAQALDYLHYGCEKRVLHRDIKSSNIMLDSDFNARIGDFGLARTIQLNENTHHSTKEIAGTPAYMAPESFHTGRATVETDVYAFGVLLLEIVTGKKPGNQGEIIGWVWDHYRMGRIIDVIDIGLNGNFEKEQTECMLMLGLACCQPNPYERPCMRTALKVLTGEAPPPNVPIEKPAFMWPVIVTSSIREESVDTLSGGQITPTIEFSGR